MTALNSNQILYIKNDLKSRKISSGYKPELLDHVCCLVEGHMNKDLDFAQAYAKSLFDFSEQGFIDLKPQSPVIKKKRKLVASQLAGATIAASILMMVLVVGAQEPPRINPLFDGAEVTSSFGFRKSPKTGKRQHHRGIDFRCEMGTPIKSTAGGIVISVEENEGGYGKKIEIEHDNSFVTRYAHLSEINVIEGQKVLLGETIGLSGNSGYSTAPHLHYEVIKNGNVVNPAEYMARNQLD
ncbi:MAG: M23 family metallopeptidase [Reichenbachiella sp.]